MYDRVTLKVFLLIIFVYILLWLTINIWPTYIDTSLGAIVAFPLLTIYLFHAVGIPGLLQNDGTCGWGWCSPTVFGWIFIVIFWLLIAWFVAKGITRFIKHSKRGNN